LNNSLAQFAGELWPNVLVPFCAKSLAHVGLKKRWLVFGLDGTAFEKMYRFYALKAEVDGHIRKTFLPKQTTLCSCFSAE